MNFPFRMIGKRTMVVLVAAVAAIAVGFAGHQGISGGDIETVASSKASKTGKAGQAGKAAKAANAAKAGKARTAHGVEFIPAFGIEYSHAGTTVAVQVPAGTLAHSVIGDKNNIEKQFAGYAISTGLGGLWGRICNWRIDFDYYGHQRQEARRAVPRHHQVNQVIK